ncbi:hypothetical protein A3711_02825 [Erythrobacter sp. HI00D59]|nr:hypothetical protein A3711_02825 [Erythrobacter sp. HI00D59]
MLLVAFVTVPAAADRAGIPLVSSGLFGQSAATLAGLREMEGEEVQFGRSGVAAATDLVGHAPLRPNSVSLLAVLLAQEGEGEKAAQAFAVAAGLGWRNVPSQAWAVDQALSAGEASIAATRMEALLRAAPESPVTAAMLDAVSADPDARAHLATAMGRGEDWPMATLAGLGGDSQSDETPLPQEQLAPRLALLKAARKAGFSPEMRRARARTQALYDNDADRAWAVWTALVGPGDSAQSGLWDTGFDAIGRDSSSGASPFEWRRAGTARAKLSRAPVDEAKDGDDDHTGGAMSRLIVNGSDALAQTVAGAIVIPEPGRYALTWRASRMQSGAPALTLQPACTRPAGGLEVGPIADRGEESGMLVIIPESCAAIDVRVFAPSQGGTERWLSDPALRRVD